MSEAQVNGATTSYVVGPEGQRLRKSGAAGTTYFAPDRSGPLLAERPGTDWVDYVWLGGRLVGRLANGQVDAVHTDQVGRPEAVTNASQSIIWRAQNFAFDRTVTVSDITMNLGFPGQYYDQETGYWNNGFRDYYPALGRYLESDPAGLKAGVNTYAYVDNNPLVRVDLLGLCPTCTAEQKKAAELASAFERTSKISGWLAFASGAGTVLSGGGEEVTFGADTPVTLSLASSTLFLDSASIITGATAASLNRFASGDLTALGNFDFRQLIKISATAAAKGIPVVSPFAENVGQLAEHAAGLVSEAQKVCRSR